MRARAFVAAATVAVFVAGCTTSGSLPSGLSQATPSAAVPSSSGDPLGPATGHVAVTTDGAIQVVDVAANRPPVTVATEVEDESIGVGGGSVSFLSGGGLWTVSADGTALTRLTPVDLTVRRALVAPDGSSYAFIAGGQVHVMSNGGTWTAARNFFPAWLLRADGVCASGAPVDLLAWSPDSRYVAFAAESDIGCVLAWIPAQTEKTRRNTWGTSEFYDPDVWSGPIEVAPTLTEVVVDGASISWGS